MYQPTEQWRSVFQGEVLRALDDCLDARRHITDANRDQAEVLGPYADADADKLRSAAENIAKASRCLSASMAHMGAAEFLALRGCGRIPTEPVASAKLLHDGDDVRLALAKLQSAREHGRDALTRLRECGGRVQGVAFMLGGLPGAPFPAPHARASIEAEISAVARELCYAHDRTVSMTALVIFATKPVARIQ